MREVHLGDYIGTFTMGTLNENLLKVNYYSILVGGSTAASVKEHPFLQDGVPTIRYFSIETANDGTVPEYISASIEKAFSRFGILKFVPRLV